MEATAIPLIPPLIVILLVIAARRVVITISAGIIAGAFIQKIRRKYFVWSFCVIGSAPLYYYWRGDRNSRIYGLEGNDHQVDIGNMAVFRRWSKCNDKFNKIELIFLK